jgi:hypothetical protein
MQPAIKSLISLGRLPLSSESTAQQIQAIQSELARICPPITDEEASELVKLFGPDDCFGLAWTLLHLIESAPGWPQIVSVEGLSGEWVDRLRERAQ